MGKYAKKYILWAHDFTTQLRTCHARAGGMVMEALVMSAPKVDTNIKKLIIEQAIAGKTSFQISKKILETYNVEIPAATVRRYRLKYKNKIVEKQQELINQAYATEPLARPEYRLKLYHKNIKAEMRRKNKAGKYIGDGGVINDALRYAAEDLKNLEMLQLKEKELELRKNLGDKVENVDELIMTVEKRITFTRQRSVANESIAEEVQWAIIDDEKARETRDGRKE